MSMYFVVCFCIFIMFHADNCTCNGMVVNGSLFTVELCKDRPSHPAPVPVTSDQWHETTSAATHSCGTVMQGDS